MSGWDYIPRLEADERMLTLVAPCTEVYEALYERLSALNEFKGGEWTQATEPVVRGDLAGILDFQWRFLDLVPGASGHIGGGACGGFAIEAEAAEWTADYCACDRLKSSGDDEAATPGGNPAFRNIFKLAFGAPQLTWTRTLFGIYAPEGHGRDLAWADYLTDFHPTLNLVTFLVLFDYESPFVWTTQVMGWGATGASPATWATVRATAWNTQGAPADDNCLGIGRTGSGTHDAIDDMSFDGDVALLTYLIFDSSGLGNAKHADDSPCPVTRLALYFQYRGSQTGDADIIENCPFLVQFQGATLGNYTALAGEDGWVSVKIDNIDLVPDVETWLVFACDFDTKTDTPAWTDPGNDQTSTYANMAWIRNISLMAEFDWAYKAGGEGWGAAWLGDEPVLV